ncbi:MAG: VOC family protein [Pseudobdellovibrio sp.]
MRYLHTMIRVENLEKTLDFFCNKLGFVEIRRQSNEIGRFTLVFLASKQDEIAARENKAPVVELTYNWPSENGEVEKLSSGRNFGHLAYEVENIYETCEHLQKNGVIIHRPPRDGYMAFIKSPDGVSIELLQKEEPLKPQEPWLSMTNTGSW